MNTNVSRSIEELKIEFRYAIACLGLVLASSLALIFSVFGPISEIESARASLAVHRKLEKDSGIVLEENRKALDQIVNAYETAQATATH